MMLSTLAMAAVLAEPPEVPDLLEGHLNLERGGESYEPAGLTYCPDLHYETEHLIRLVESGELPVQVHRPTVQGGHVEDSGRRSILIAGVHPGQICEYPERSLAYDETGRPVSLEGAAWVQELPEGGIEALVETTGLTEPVQVTTPTYNAMSEAVVGVGHLEAGTEVGRSLPIRGVDGESWVAIEVGQLTGYVPAEVFEEPTATEPEPVETTEEPEPTTVEPAPVETAETPAGSTQTPPLSERDATPMEQTETADPASPWPWVAGGLGLLVLGAAAGTALTRRALNNNDKKETDDD